MTVVDLVPEAGASGSHLAGHPVAGLMGGVSAGRVDQMEGDLLNRLSMAQVRNALNTLTAEEQRLVGVYGLTHCSMSEAAVLLGCKKSWVCRRYSAVIRKLRRKLVCLQQKRMVSHRAVRRAGGPPAGVED